MDISNRRKSVHFTPPLTLTCIQEAVAVRRVKRTFPEYR